MMWDDDNNNNNDDDDDEKILPLIHNRIDNIIITYPWFGLISRWSDPAYFCIV